MNVEGEEEECVNEKSRLYSFAITGGKKKVLHVIKQFFLTLCFVQRLPLHIHVLCYRGFTG